VDAALVDVDEEHAGRIEGDAVFEELAAGGGGVEAGGETAGLDLGDEAAAIARDEEVGAEVDGEGAAIDGDAIRKGGLAHQDAIAEAAEKGLGANLAGGPALAGEAEAAAGEPAQGGEAQRLDQAEEEDRRDGRGEELGRDRGELHSSQREGRGEVGQVFGGLCGFTGWTDAAILRPVADTSFILEEIRKARPMTFVAAGFLVVVGIGLCFVPVEAGAAAWVPFAKWGVVVAFAGLALLTFVNALQPPEKHAAMLLLRETPERIVWAHVQVQRTNGVHTATTLILCTDQGKRVGAPLPRSEEGEQRGLALVRAVAPRATVGFRPEYEGQFAKDPASLRQG
jgi:hypothetical protein